MTRKTDGLGAGRGWMVVRRTDESLADEIDMGQARVYHSRESAESDALPDDRIVHVEVRRVVP